MNTKSICIEIINIKTPPAILNAPMVIWKISKIKFPVMRKNIKMNEQVNVAFRIMAFLSSSVFCWVIAKKRGTLPMGSMMENRVTSAKEARLA